MAKEQDLSLNPQKISGVCGRLMCCLRYEFDAYKDFKSRAPKINAQIETPEGKAKVVELDVPREVVTIKTAEDKKIKIPLVEMKKAKGEDRPSIVDQETFDTYADPVMLDASLDIFTSTLQLTGNDKLASRPCGGSCGHKQGDKPPKQQEQKQSRKRRRRTHVNGDEVTSESNSSREKSGNKKDNRSGKPKRAGQNQKRNSSKGPENKNNGNTKSARKPSGGNKGAERGNAGNKPRPGQKSSGLRGSGGDNKPQTKAAASTQNNQSSSGRKSRRRSHKAGSTSHE